MNRAGVVGFIKFGMAYKPTLGTHVSFLYCALETFQEDHVLIRRGKDQHDEAMLGLWATVQMVCSTICCCIMTYRPLLGRSGFFSRLASTISTSRSIFRSGLSSPSDADHISQDTGKSDWTRSERLNGKSFVATEINASNSYGVSSEFLGVADGNIAYPMKTISVQRSVENV